jgi:hypothetical protein
MKIKLNEPARTFRVGHHGEISLKDCAHIVLAPDEQVTFITEAGSEYDVVRKSWGFYATPSLNGRLLEYGLHAALVKSQRTAKFNIFLREQGKEKEFEVYCQENGHEVICWLDRDEALAGLERSVHGN